MKKVLFVLIVTFVFQLSVFSQIEKSTKTEIKNGYEYFVHEVQKGQTLYGISKLYAIPIDSILTHNNNISGSLQIGQIIFIPTNKKISQKQDIDNNKPKISSWHTVEQGETLFSIARKYNTNVDELKKMNPGINDNLSINQRIEVPSQKKELYTSIQKEIKDTAIKPVSIDSNSKINNNENKQETENSIITKPSQSSNKITNEINIALMVPLFTHQNSSINISDIKSVSDISNIQSFKFIQFYLGFLEGLKQFEGSKIQLNLKIYDVAEGVSSVKKILSDVNFSKTHLIVGPLFASTFYDVQKWANINGVYIINPFTMQNNIVNNSPVTFKLTCCQKEKYNQLASSIVQQFPNSNIILVYNKTSDTTNVSLIKEGFSKSNHSSNVKDVIYNERGINGINERYELNRPNVIISFISGEATITNYVRRLYELKKDSIYLFCPSEWMVYDNIETEYLQYLNAHFYGDYFVDYKNQETLEYIQKFIHKYHTEPLIENFGFQGYDIATFFIGLMIEYKDEWIFNINNSKHKLLSLKLAFKKKSIENGFENTQIQIIKLCNYEFIPYNNHCEMNREEIRY